MWRASASLGKRAEVFTSVADSGNYGPPPGFDFDILSHDPPIQDDPRLDGYNVEERVAAFIEEVKKKASIYRGGDIMLQMGSDFHYQNAAVWYKNLDK
mmetsp:Transcript_40922/g.130781  ORF Transcript_40922/g.130781 Transcript_40922/m.130781 type:complete len:98 (+) Transcript_40922:553-846(+)